MMEFCHPISPLTTIFIALTLLISIIPPSSSRQKAEKDVDGIPPYPFPPPPLREDTKILIQGGTVVNGHMTEIADVLVIGGKIVRVGQLLLEKMRLDNFTRVINATGKYVMPGGIDPHTHLHLDVGGTVSQDDYLSGQSAALAGGTTMTMDFVMPTNGSYIKGLETYFKNAELAVTDYGFHAQIIFWNQTVSDELEIMVKEYGMNSFKFFQALDFMIRDDQMLEGFEKCKSLGAIAMLHAENGDSVIHLQKKLLALGVNGVRGHPLSRPPFMEAEGVSRAIRLARTVNVPLYFVHIMSADAMREIANARSLGQRVIGQPVIAGIALNSSWYWHPDFDTASKYVISPPISPPGHDKALQAALSRGILQLVGTDHCPYNTTQRRVGIDDFTKLPTGVNGIEERMHVLWQSMVNSGQIGVMDYVRLTSAECAKIFNIYPQKGAILPGSDADIIILNPNATFHISAKTHHSNSDVNIFEGVTGEGKIEVTIAGGKIVWINDQLFVTPGSGRYIKMPPYGYLYEGIDKQDAAFINSLNHSNGSPYDFINPVDSEKFYLSDI